MPLLLELSSKIMVGRGSPCQPVTPRHGASSARPGASPRRAQTSVAGAAGLEAKLLALRVGQHHPAGLGKVVRDHCGAESEEPTDLLVLGPVRPPHVHV